MACISLKGDPRQKLHIVTIIVASSSSSSSSSHIYHVIIIVIVIGVIVVIVIIVTIILVDIILIGGSVVDIPLTQLFCVCKTGGPALLIQTLTFITIFVTMLKGTDFSYFDACFVFLYFQENLDHETIKVKEEQPPHTQVPGLAVCAER